MNDHFKFNHLLVAALIGIFLSGNILLAHAETQTVTLTTSSLSVEPSKSFVVKVSYNVSDGNNTLNGIGVNIHYDTSVLLYNGYDNVLTTGLIGDPSIKDDIDNKDGDDSTDKYVTFPWSDFMGNWPNQSLPVDLVHLQFIVNDDVPLSTTTTIYSTEQSSDLNYEFAGMNLSVNIDKSNNPPEISEIADVVINEDDISSIVSFTVSNPDCDTLTQVVSSANSNLISDDNLVISCVDDEVSCSKSCSLEITPESGKTGSSIITLNVSDGHSIDSKTFNCKVGTVTNQLTISPSTTTVEPVEGNPESYIFTIDLLVTGSNIFGVQTTCESSDIFTFQSASISDTFFEGREQFNPISMADGNKWTIATSMRNPAQPLEISDDRLYATLTYKAKMTTETGFITCEALYSDNNANELEGSHSVTKSDVYVDDHIHGGNGSILGQLVFPDGTAVTNTLISLKLEDHKYSIKTDDEGNFQFDNLKSGNFSVSIEGSQAIYINETTANVIDGTPIDLSTITTRLVGDTNDDCIVDVEDYNLILTNFTKKEGDEGFNSKADLKPNGVIDLLDLTSIGIMWDKTCHSH